ncbi:MAG TPA: PstS family phosphate ABC transporter substrate-binding protein [Candidatus Competibacteraceae bacterium]|nr:PstS family phosphate ABC transporter substrate-binding protein [Candidatus Competibacteraceae bacterium]
MIPKKLALAVALGTLSLSGTALAQSARDYISIVGSSTVYPFSTAVAEQFGKSGGFKTPKVESTGSGGGIKLFCGGVGVQHPDITNASRRIKPSEVETCAKNGVTEIVEVKIGFDGIAIANSKKAAQYKLTLKDVYTALAKEVPDPKDPTKFIPNPYKTWNEIDKALPNTKIEVLGPPPTSGTRDAFVELAMEKGCEEYAAVKELKKSDEKRFKEVCHTIREDGAFVEAGENDNLIVQKLEANPNALGVFGYSFLEQNLDKMQGSVINGVAPEFETIASGKYPIARDMYFYVKKAHIGVIPGLKEYIAEFISDKAMGEDGYLADKGLIPLPEEERAKVQAAAKALQNLSL